MSKPIAPPSESEQAEVLLEIIKILRPLDQDARERILLSVALFYGVRA